MKNSPQADDPPRRPPFAGLHPSGNPGFGKTAVKKPGRGLFRFPAISRSAPAVPRAGYSPISPSNTISAGPVI